MNRIQQFLLNSCTYSISTNQLLSHMKYLYTLTAACLIAVSSWGQISPTHTTLYPNDTLSDLRFGMPMSNGKQAALIATGFKDASDLSVYGGMYIYDFDSVNSTYTFRQRIVHHSPSDQFNFTGWGQDYDMSEDLMIIGARLENTDTGQVYGNGRAHIYRADANGDWNLEASLTCFEPDSGFNRQFGSEVAISNNTAAVYTSNDKELSIFTYNSNNQWELTQRIDGTPYGYNWCELLQFDGNYLYVGQSRYDHRTTGGGYITQSGAVHVFHFNTTTQLWEYDRILELPQPKAYDTFGMDMKFSGNEALVSTRVSDSSAVYTFERDANMDWQLRDTIYCPVLEDSERFGAKLDRVGNRLSVLTRHAQVDTAYEGSRIYAFEKNSITGKWEHTHTITDPVPTNKVYTLDYFCLVNENQFLWTDQALDYGNSVRVGVVYSYDLSLGIGLNEWTKSESLHIYPNPSSSIVYFDDNNASDPINRVEVVNTAGTIVMETEIQNNQINLSPLTKGIYILRATSAGGRFAISRVVLK